MKKSLIVCASIALSTIPSMALANEYDGMASEGFAISEAAQQNTTDFAMAHRAMNGTTPVIRVTSHPYNGDGSHFGSDCLNDIPPNLQYAELAFPTSWNVTDVSAPALSTSGWLAVTVTGTFGGTTEQHVAIIQHDSAANMCNGWPASTGWIDLGKPGGFNAITSPAIISIDSSAQKDFFVAVGDANHAIQLLHGFVPSTTLQLSSWGAVPGTTGEAFSAPTLAFSGFTVHLMFGYSDLHTIFHVGGALTVLSPPPLGIGWQPIESNEFRGRMSGARLNTACSSWSQGSNTQRIVCGDSGGGFFGTDWGSSATTGWGSATPTWTQVPGLLGTTTTYPRSKPAVGVEFGYNTSPFGGYIVLVNGVKPWTVPPFTDQQGVNLSIETSTPGSWGNWSLYYAW